MRGELLENDKNTNWVKIMGIAMGVPSTIIGLFFAFYALDSKGILELKYGIVIMIVAVINTFYIMIKYAAKKNKD